MKRIVGDRAARFWQNVYRKSDDECWLWIGQIAFHRGGYGLMYDQGMRHAHRVSWEINVGPIPFGLWVLHRCDNPPCVNPRHLFLGDNADNVRDMDTKGRRRTVAPRGESQHDAKLSEATVREIRLSPESGRRLALRFGVNRTTIDRVRSGRTWGWLSSD